MRIDEDVVGYLESQFGQGSRAPSRLASPTINRSMSDLSVYAQAAASISPIMEVDEEDPKIAETIKGLDEWTFDLEPLEQASSRNGLVHVMRYLLADGAGDFDASLCGRLNLDRSAMVRFFSTIQSGYDAKNPYHNSTHGADVAQAYHVFLLHMQENFVATDLEKLAILTSAACHDYRHPGTNNSFLVNTAHPIALTYNDMAVLESYHAAESAKVLLKADNNFMARLSRDDFLAVRALMIKLILATDMSRHFDFVNQFKNKSEVGLDGSNQEDRLLVFSMAMKGADISNGARPLEIGKRWSFRIMEEFFAQGDREKQAGLVVSPFMDRETTSFAKCQAGFISFLVRPAFQLLGTFLDGELVSEFTQGFERTIAYWQGIVDAEAAEAEAAKEAGENLEAKANAKSAQAGADADGCKTPIEVETPKTSAPPTPKIKVHRDSE